MSHIHNEPGQYDLAASAHIFDISGDEPKVIMHKHKRLKKYMHFGGHVELDESPWEAVTHEVLEESGFDIDQLMLLQPAGLLKQLPDAKLHPLPVNINSHKYGDEDHYHTDLAYAFVTTKKPRHAINEQHESMDVTMFTREELVNLSDDETIENIRLVALAVFDNLLEQWEQVDPTEFN